MKSLIIEDDLANLKLTSVVLAASAGQAIYSIKAVKPDVILLDVRPPGIKGLAVARQCRGEPEPHDVPIIAVSAFSEEHGRDGALKAGGDAYIVKPINPRTLLQQIVDAIAAKAISAALKTSI